MENNRLKKHNPDSLKKPAGPADYLANERTFLAWIRTSIALMGFGFVIVKFSLFMRQLSFMMGSNLTIPENRYSAFIGFVMVSLGAMLATLAYLRYRSIQKQLDADSYFPSPWLSLLVTLLIVTGSILLLFYLWPNL
jgi:putative membrane protein